MVEITEVAARSRAARAGIRAGDFLISINENEIKDVLDYKFYLADEQIKLLCDRAGERFAVEIKKDTYDDIGLSFASALMDEKHSCRNKCIFCFIDQLPPNMRSTLYFKDDDSRLSFLHGNYITLTNMKDDDIDRIIKMRFSPVRVSVHTTDPELRVEMMKNRRAGEVLSYLRRIADAGLSLNAQIVLCRGVNDGEALLRTMRDLSELYPALDSVSVVPAGLTKFRDGLYPLSPYTPKECAEITETVDRFGDEMVKKHGVRIFYCADELYIKAGRALPGEDYYDGYSQFENGVGLITSLVNEFDFELEDARSDPELCREIRENATNLTIATGVAAAPTMQMLSEKFTKQFPEYKITVKTIINDFFGHEITVAGLLTGRDIAAQLEGVELGERLLLSRTCLKADEEIFLCDMTATELSARLSTPIVFCEESGTSLFSAIAGIEL